MQDVAIEARVVGRTPGYGTWILTENKEQESTKPGPNYSPTPLGLATEAVLGTAVLIGLGVWAGNWLDAKFDTDPIFTVLLPILGVILGLARMVKMAFDSDSGSSKGS